MTVILRCILVALLMSLQACPSETGTPPADVPAGGDNPPMVVTMSASTTSDDGWNVVWTHTSGDNEHTDTAHMRAGDRDWKVRRIIKGGNVLTLTAYGSRNHAFECAMKSASQDIIVPQAGTGEVTCEFRYPSRRDG